jgi:hypothetical protein
LQLQKDETIIRLLAKLRERLGVAGFDVVDHWELDLCAVGIARRGESKVLVYVSTHGQPESTYFVSLELPPESGNQEWANHPYTPAGECVARSFEELVEVIRKHLAI